MRIDQNLVLSSKEFDPNNDVDPNRSIAVLRIQNNQDEYAGPDQSLIGAIEHITPSVMKPLLTLTRNNLYESGNESNDSDED